MATSMTVNPGDLDRMNPYVSKKDIYWNHSHQDKPGYSLELVGTIVSIQLKQDTEFMSPKPKFWQNRDGSYSPAMVLRVAVADRNGELKCFTSRKASSNADWLGQRPCLQVELVKLGNNSIANMIGKTVRFTVNPGPYSRQNPHIYHVELVEEGPYQLNEDLPEEFLQYELIVARTPQEYMQQQQQVQPPAYGGIQFTPVQQPPVQQQPVYQQPVPQQQPVPAMDPQVVQNMQQTQPQQQQELPSMADVYNDLPF